MRTWSVRGTALALCTRSSSLSMRTRTSIRRSSLLLVTDRGAAAAVGEHLLQAACDGRGYQLFDISAEGCDLLHPARRDETDLRAGHHVNRLDLRRQRPVQLVHLELVLEVRDHPQPLHDRLGIPAPGEIDDELAEDVDLDVVQVERLLQEPDALVDREHRRLVV